MRCVVDWKLQNDGTQKKDLAFDIRQGSLDIHLCDTQSLSSQPIKHSPKKKGKKKKITPDTSKILNTKTKPKLCLSLKMITDSCKKPTEISQLEN